MTNLVLFGIVVLISIVSHALAQCSNGDDYYCVDRTIIRTCTSVTPIDCSMRNGSNLACFPGRGTETNACLPATDVCTDEGNFPLKKAFALENNLCGDFYTCTSTAVADEYLLTKYDRCVQNLEFSAALRRCVPIDEADCSQPFTTTPATTRAPTTTISVGSPCVSGDKEANQSGCKSYYLCDAYGKYQKYNCNFSRYYDTVTKVCVSDSSVCGQRPLQY